MNTINGCVNLKLKGKEVDKKDDVKSKSEYYKPYPTSL
jgi:hypothetical protein